MTLLTDQKQMTMTVFEDLTPEFLSCLKTFGLPNHSMKLKIGTCLMLIKNLNQCEGLCNDTRLTVTRLANHVIKANIFSGIHIGNTIYIPKMSLSHSQSLWSFKFIQRQFPIIALFAMILNKSQEQSLHFIGLYLSQNIFRHSQLYVTMSRVKNKDELKILTHDRDKKTLAQTPNVVFKYIFFIIFSIFHKYFIHYYLFYVTCLLHVIPY